MFHIEDTVRSFANILIYLVMYFSILRDQTGGRRGTADEELRKKTSCIDGLTISQSFSLDEVSVAE